MSKVVSLNNIVLELFSISSIKFNYFLKDNCQLFYNSRCFHFIQKIMNILMVLFAFVSVINGYKILFLSPHNAKSHQIYMQSFVKALLNRGHHVTFLTSAPFYWPNGVNYTEILVDPPFDTDTIRKIFHSILLKLNEMVKKFFFVYTRASGRLISSKSVVITCLHSKTPITWNFVIKSLFIHQKCSKINQTKRSAL